MSKADWGVAALMVMACALAVLIVMTCPDAVGAQEKQDVKPYMFAEIQNGLYASENSATKVYKAVSQGCELFIVVDTYGDSRESHPVAIATGRGCK